MGKSGNKHHPIEAWAPVKTASTVVIKCIVPFPNSKLDDIVKYVTNPEFKKLYDDNFTKIECVKTMPLDNKLLNINLKTIWPLGARDLLLQEGQVRF